MTLENGTRFGAYTIVEPLGRGGMATVYKAYEVALERHVALKVLPAEFLHDPTFAERFRREARVIARLEHPNIVPIYAYDIDTERGIPWMAMRLIRGGTVAQLLQKGKIGKERAVDILRGAALALDYAHVAGVIHRDVKPQNILLDDAMHAYLADFGIARIAEGSTQLTQTGMITGTPQYMAPEQAVGTTVGTTADIYSLGIVAYQMLTGRVPFTADTPVAIMMKHVSAPVPTPAREEVPEGAVEALVRCIAKKPEDRFGTATAFVDALDEGWTSERPPASPAPAGRVPPPTGAALPPKAWRSDHSENRNGARWAVLLALVALVLGTLVAAGVAFLLWRRPDAREVRVRPSARPALATESQAPLPVQSSPATPVPPTPTLLSSPGALPTAAPTPRSISTPRPTPRPSEQPTALPAPPTAAPAPPTPPSTAAPPPISPAVQGRIAELTASDPLTRAAAAQALGVMGAEARPAISGLVEALGDRYSEVVRARSAEALGKLGFAGGGVVEALAGALADRDLGVRREAARALGRLGASAGEAVGPLARGLMSGSVEYRREVAGALADIGAPSRAALSLLVGALADKDPAVRASAARALGRIGPDAQQALSVLAALARDSDPRVAAEAQEAAKRIRGEQ